MSRLVITVPSWSCGPRGQVLGSSSRWHHFVVGFVLIDPVILVKFAFHFLSVVLSARLNLETGVSCSSMGLSTFVTFSRIDLETPARNKRKSQVVASQGQGRRAVRQAVAKGGSDRDVLRRLIEVLATLSLVNAAELRGLPATVPCAEPVAEAMAEAGRFYHEVAGAIKDRPEAERAEAHEQLGPPFVHVWVAKGWRRCNWRRTFDIAAGSRARRSRARKGGRASCSASIRLLSHSSRHWKQRCSCRRESGSTARLREASSRGGSIGAPGTDAGEAERLARRQEAVSQRMADLLRQGVLEPSLAYAFLMKKGGQQVPVAESKAKGRTRGQAPTNEGAVIAPDVSPPRLPPEKPPIAVVRGETLEPSTARPKVRISRRSPAVWSSFYLLLRKD